MSARRFRWLPVAVLVLTAACVPSLRPAPRAAAVAPPLSWRDTPVGLGEIDPRWWRGFGDPALDGVVERALARNTDVLTAIAVVDQARANVRLARSALLPTLDADGSATRSKQGGPATTTLTGTIDASWEIDLFGRLRALDRAARRSYVASQADRDATALSVASETARGYITLLSLDAQLRVTRETLKSRAQTLRLTQNQRDVGYVSDFELTQAQSEYQSIAQQIPQLVQSVRAQENSLAILTGDLPSAIPRAVTLRDLVLPSVPATMPSALLRRRPDVAAAEFRLAAADATMASRRAEFLPQINLSGSYGAVATSIANYNPVTVWSLGGSLLAPLFHGGALRANLDIATALRDQAAFAYRGVVLSAFGDVETALSATTNLAAQNQRVLARLAILRRSLTLASERYTEGYSSFLDQLDAQRNLYTSELNAITTREAQLANAVTLATALGGGWMPERLTGTREGDPADGGRTRLSSPPSASGLSGISGVPASPEPRGR